jgi:hypothetical protein
METTLPGRRATRIAKLLLDAGWWLLIVAAVLALALTLLWPVFTAGDLFWGTRVNVSIPDDAARELLPLATPDTLIAREPELTAVDAVLRFEMSGPRSILLEWIVALPFLAALLYGLYLARSLLADVLAAKVFSTLNADRLSRLGWLLIGAGVALPILDFLHGAFLVRRAGVEGVPFSIGIGSMGTVLPGLLVLVLAGAWRYGAELQKDRDLVV